MTAISTESLTKHYGDNVALGTDRPGRPHGATRLADRPQRLRQDHVAADARRNARAQQRLGNRRRASGRKHRSACSTVGPVRPTRLLRRPVACGSTSSTSLASTTRPTGRTTPNWLLESVGLIDRADDLPATFSRGLKQKAAIAIAFVRPFDVMLIDEPFVGLDRAGRAALLDLLSGPTVTVRRSSSPRTNCRA